MSSDEKVFEEVCKMHAGIADFRHKLLALLPVASGAGIFLLIGDKLPTNSPHLLPVGIFGALVTLGFFWYELRGIYDCWSLMKRGAALQSKLLGSGDNLGPFRPHDTPILWVVGAEGAALTIYPSVLGAWTYVAVVGRAPCSMALAAAIAAVIGTFSIGIAALRVYRLRCLKVSSGSR